MQIMASLRDIYASADYSTAFLEAAIRKAEITFPQRSGELKQPRNVITSAQGLMDVGRRMKSGRDSGALTPPPDAQQTAEQTANEQMSDDDIAKKLNTYLASTPPTSEHQHNSGENTEMEASEDVLADFDTDFDSMINLDAAGDTWLLEDGAYAAMQGGESSGFTMDMDWLKGMREGGMVEVTEVGGMVMPV